MSKNAYLPPSVGGVGGGFHKKTTDEAVKPNRRRRSKFGARASRQIGRLARTPYRVSREWFFCRAKAEVALMSAGRSVRATLEPKAKIVPCGGEHEKNLRRARSLYASRTEKSYVIINY